MSIRFDSEARIFVLETAHTSYHMKVDALGHLLHLYYGKTIGTGDLMQLYPRTDRGFSPDYYAYRTHRGVSPDLLPQEYTGCNVGDFRLSCLTVADSRGAFGADFTYVSHTVEAGKYQLTGLPCAHAEENDAETLIVRMQDEATGLTLELLYGVFAQQDVITRAARLTNHGDTPLRLDRAASACLDLPFGRWDLLHFHGRHAMERQLEREAVGTNIQTISSVRGSSSHHNNPFLILCQQDATETSGACYGVMMVYSGSYQMDVERSQTGLVRVVSGIQEERFAWNLKPGETFDTPEVILSFAAEGLTPLSQQYHRFLRRNICRGPWKDKRRPVLINNWEATYFDFNTEKIVKIAEKAASLGVEMMVLDDGWFGTRNDDNQGLGDWTVNCEKLPCGLDPLIEQINALGMKFGLWIEPEMVNPKSELYEKHKDWVIHLPNRDEYYFRNQMVLDLTNPKVQDYVYGVVDNLMTKYPGIAYFKWDCNSPITNIYSPYLKDQQSHLYIEYVRGLYNVLERIKQKYPNLPMMLCSGGGGRCDYEALKYFTEFWPSDNTDAVERIFIQWGYSHFFPAKSMAAHVTSWGKQPVKFRTDVASMCKLGFDIRIHEMSQTDQQYCKEAVANFKRLDDVILDGDQYRLQSPYESQHAAVMYANDNADKAVLFAFDIHPRYAESIQPLRLQGLKEDARYELKEINLVPGTQSRLACNGKTFSGEFLMNVGIPVFSSRPTNSHVIEITEVK